MSDMTVKEATRAKAEAEEQIREILIRLIRETGACAISVNLRTITSLSFSDGQWKLYLERFDIKLEV